MFFELRGNKEDLSEQRVQWAIAENTATWYGVEYAKDGYGVTPTKKEAGLLMVTQVYREGVRANQDIRYYGYVFPSFSLTAKQLSFYFDPFNPWARPLISNSSKAYWAFWPE